MNFCYFKVLKQVAKCQFGEFNLRSQDFIIRRPLPYCTWPSYKQRYLDLEIIYSKCNLYSAEPELQEASIRWQSVESVPFSTESV